MAHKIPTFHFTKWSHFVWKIKNLSPINVTLLGNVSDGHGPLVVAKLYVMLKAVEDISGDVHGNIETFGSTFFCLSSTLLPP